MCFSDNDASSSVKVATFLLFTNAKLFSQAFPLQSNAISNAPFVHKDIRRLIASSMVAEDNVDNESEPAADNQRKYSPSSRIQSTGNGFANDDPSDWIPMDYAEINEFFSDGTISQHDYDDDDIGSEDPDELLLVLEDIIESTDQAEWIDDRAGKTEFHDIDEDLLQEILGPPFDSVSKPSADVAETENFDDWARLVSDEKIYQKNREAGRGMEILEKALSVGVVPAEAGVGSGMLPGDYGFDPLNLSTKDYFRHVQNFILNLVPERKSLMNEKSNPEAGAALPTAGFLGEEERPTALILRDYKEAEIRHGRLAMLAAVIWPMQEILDRILIPESFGSTTVIYGGPTLPFLPLVMTFFMLCLGYLDIYSAEIKENESGDAFLPGECFWDPLSILEGAPDQMKRNMQEREILNGRAAMIAVAAFLFEEAMTHKPILILPGNELLFEPAYQVPFIQAWLDSQFGSFASYSNTYP